MFPQGQQPPQEQLPPVQQPVAAPPQAPVTGQQAPIPDPAVLRMQQQLNGTRAEVERLRGLIMQPSQPAQPVAAPDIRELNRQFNQNPVEMAAAIATRAAQEAVNNRPDHGLDTLAAAAREMARQEDPQLFDQYAAEIEANVANVAPQFRTNINVWKNAFKMVKGSHVDDILRARGQQPPADPPRAPAVHISTGDGPARPTAAAPPAGQPAPLTDAEKRTARKFGITEEQYRAGKEANLNQSDVLDNPLGPSSWDAHVTFDSKQKRRQQRAAAQRR